MWDGVMKMEEAEQHETELKEIYWKSMISHGATDGRFYINQQSGPKSPWTIIDDMSQQYQSRQPELPEPPIAYKTKKEKARNLKSNDIVIV
jgi:hypothetical protein